MQLPRLAAVVGAEHAARRVGGLDARVDAPRIRGRDVDADLAERRFGMPGLNVISFQVSPPSVVFHMPLRPPPGSCTTACAGTSTSTRRGCAGWWGRCQVVAPVESSTNSTFFHVFPPSVVRNTPRSAFGPNAWPMRRDVDAIGVARVDDDVADLLRVARGRGAPGLRRRRSSGTRRCRSEVFAQLRFAGADVDHVRIRRRDRDRADGRDVGLAVGDVAPGLPAVRRLPHAAVHGAEVDDARMGVAGDGVDASAAEWADESPAQCLESRRGRRWARVEARVVSGFDCNG